MEQRALGKLGLRVPMMGLGCMGMSEFYGPGDEEESIATIHRAMDAGVIFLDTADMYGPFKNERLVGKAIRTRRHEIVLATKFGNERREDGTWIRVNGRPEYVKAACEMSLKRLGMTHIDLLYQHRVDPEVPIEDTVGAMADLVKEGKVRFLGLSEAGAKTIRRARAVHPITALQTEYSLWTRDAEGEILSTCRELGIGFVAYSPLGRGFPHRPISSGRGRAGGGQAQADASISRGELRPKHGTAGSHKVPGIGGGHNAGTTCSVVGSGTGRGYRTDFWNQAVALSGGKPRRRAGSACSFHPGAHRRGRAPGRVCRLQVPRRGHARRQPLTRRRRENTRSTAPKPFVFVSRMETRVTGCVLKRDTPS